jgi:hypothetical protein
MDKAVNMHTHAYTYHIKDKIASLKYSSVFFHFSVRRSSCQYAFIRLYMLSICL